MTTLLTGGTGFVGQSLIKRLEHVSVTSRNGSKAKQKLGDSVDQVIQWDPAKEPLSLADSPPFDSVVNLMGESIAEGRWTSEKKARIRSSRGEGTRKLVDALIDSENLPGVFISASAIGIYGDCGEAMVEESHEHGTGFLTDVCEDWESATKLLSEHGVRVVHLRIGIVLGDRGGALEKLKPLFRWCLGGPLGNGHHWMAWIHVQDLVSMILWAIENDSVSGPVNAAAPNPVRNSEFTKALAKSLGRPAILPAPRFLVRLALGEFADSLFFSQRVIPGVALANGFQFRFPDIRAAIMRLRNRKDFRMMNFAGIDIGGANIKLAILDGESKQLALPIWKDKHQLREVLTRIANALAPDTYLGVTMTAELADCFDTKRNGVEFIVRAVVESFPNQDPLFYRTDGTMCDARAAIKQWRSVAASNWHALASMAFSNPDDHSGFVFDIGSTTTDMIPVQNGSPVVGNQDDFERLSNGQLLYAGVERTPVCSILSVVQLSGRSVTIARELFATMSDVFLWLGELTCDESNETADGRPANRQYAGQRLARMVCADFDDLGSAKVDAIAVQAKHALVQKLSGCLKQVVSNNPALPLIVKTFGKGDWLVDEVVDTTFDDLQRNQPKVISFSKDETVNQTAPALAVAKFRKKFHSQSSVIHG